MKTQKRATGDRGEEIAESYLKKLGYRIVEKNWNCRNGEIDIIAEEKVRTLFKWRKVKELVFIEVKTRKTTSQGSAIDAITALKMEKVKHAAQLYLLTHGLEDAPYRFDAIAITLLDNNNPDIRHEKYI